MSQVADKPSVFQKIKQFSIKEVCLTAIGISAFTAVITYAIRTLRRAQMDAKLKAKTADATMPTDPALLVCSDAIGGTCVGTQNVFKTLTMDLPTALTDQQTAVNAAITNLQANVKALPYNRTADVNFKTQVATQLTGVQSGQTVFQRNLTQAIGLLSSYDFTRKTITQAESDVRIIFNSINENLASFVDFSQKVSASLKAKFKAKSYVVPVTDLDALANAYVSLNTRFAMYESQVLGLSWVCCNNACQSGACTAPATPDDDTTTVPPATASS
jgi:hypothetical protein